MRPNKIGQLAYIDHDNFSGFLNDMNPIFMITDIVDEENVSIIMLAKNLLMIETHYPDVEYHITHMTHEHYFDEDFFEHDHFVSAVAGIPSRYLSFPRNSLFVLDSKDKAFDDMFLTYPIQISSIPGMRESFSDFVDTIYEKILSYQQ